MATIRQKMGMDGLLSIQNAMIFPWIFPIWGRVKTLVPIEPQNSW